MFDQNIYRFFPKVLANVIIGKVFFICGFGDIDTSSDYISLPASNFQSLDSSNFFEDRKPYLSGNDEIKFNGYSKIFQSQFLQCL